MKGVKEELAVKQMTEDDAYETWTNESDIHSAIENHDSILPLFASFEDSDGKGYCIITKWCQGETLKDEALRGPDRVLSEKMLRELGLDILKGLVHLREQCVIHNDVKPSNIFLDQPGKGAKLADFGQSVKHLGGKEEPVLKRLEKEYAAPEQIKFKKGSFAVDVWSLGVSLYEVLVGYLPTLDDDYNLLSDKKFSRLSSNCQDLIHDMLTANPKHRPTPEKLLTHEFFTSCQLQSGQLQLKQAQEQVPGDSREQEEQADQEQQNLSWKHRREVEEENDEESSTPAKRTRLLLRDSDVEYFSDVSDEGDNDNTEDWKDLDANTVATPPAGLIGDDEHEDDEEGGDAGDDERSEEESENASDDENQSCGEDGKECASEDGNEDDNDDDSIKKQRGFRRDVRQYASFDADLIDYEKKKKGGQHGDIEVVVIKNEEKETATASCEQYNDDYSSDEDEGEMVEVPPY
ncbi:Serine/threonine-protein kinase plk1 [Mortierella sp. 14UC]|nr:Serine/threonine-protein kinase plk1 [Mortierella sp. 14UC]